MNKMFCKKCGSQMEDSATACTACGNLVGAAPPPAGQPATILSRFNTKRGLLIACACVVVLVIGGILWMNLSSPSTGSDTMRLATGAETRTMEKTLQNYAVATAAFDFKEAALYCTDEARDSVKQTAASFDEMPDYAAISRPENLSELLQVTYIPIGEIIVTDDTAQMECYQYIAPKGDAIDLLPQSEWKSLVNSLLLDNPKKVMIHFVNEQGKWLIVSF